jgi:glycine/D-amino acid oxidase-like deaminating enzyme
MKANVDVLIIGGGIQGLWLLNDLLQSGHSAFLITNADLGSGQSLHSHGYIHHGYQYGNKVPLAKRLKGVAEFWNKFTSHHRLSRPSARPVFGFIGGAEDNLLRWWAKAQLPMYACDLPTVLRGGVINKVYNTDEIWFDGEAIIKNLGEAVADLVGYGEVLDIEGDQTQRTVHARIKDAIVSFSAKVLVLAAGAGNLALLEKAATTDPIVAGELRQYGVEGPQRLRRSQMLVLKGAGLPVFAGHFHDFLSNIVSRADGPSSAWLVSHRIDNETNDKSLSDPPIDKERLRGTISALRAITPAIFDLKLLWGVYTGIKCEGRIEAANNEMPHEEIINTFDTRNLIAVWPTKLTLAPQASHSILLKIKEVIPHPSGRFNPVEHGIPIVAARIGHEKWRTVDCVPWSEFRQLYYDFYRTKSAW